MLPEPALRIGRTCLRQLPALLGVALLIGAIYVVQKEFRHLRLHDIGIALKDIPARALAIAFLWTILSYGVLTIYDRLGTIYAGHKVSYGRVAFASFCAYALSHNLGFAAVSGAAACCSWNHARSRFSATTCRCSSFTASALRYGPSSLPT
jgi:uncharacterized membrane protein YbhN (UPF0104 family)